MSDFKLPIYPLEKVLEVKKKRVEESAKILSEKKRILEQEKEKLKKAIEAKNKVEEHKNNKLAQLRQILDSTTNTDKIQKSRAYLDVVNSKLKVEIEKVQKQQHSVNTAQVAFDNAKKIWEERRKEVEKIEKHKEGWLKQAYKELVKEEEKNTDELGSIVFLTQRISNPIDLF